MKNLTAFGAGVLVATLALFAVAATDHSNVFLSYLTYGPLWFGLGYSVTLIAIHSVDIYLYYLEFLDRVAFMKLSTAKKYQEIKDLGKRNVPGPEVVIDQKPKTTRYGELWRLYWIEMFTYAEQCGGIGFNKTKDFFGKSRSRALATWRQAIKPWVQQGVVWPIAEGERTELSESFTLQGVRMWLENNHNLDDRYIPPYPPPTPFESAPDQPGEPGETSGKPQEPGSETVYAKDVKR